MNIEFAKTIPLTAILSKLGIKPTKQKEDECWYLSPFRKEGTASFKINTKKNIWYDFGAGIGGDPINFVCEHLKGSQENHTVPDALRWLKNMMGYVPEIIPVVVPDYTKEDKKLVLRSVKPIEHTALIQYLEDRGVPLKIAKEYYKELRVFNKNTKKSFFALGFNNEEGGYELRNPFFKACVSPKAITFIRGKVPKPDGINIFEGSMDYLSMLIQREGKKFDDDTIILNSLSCLKEATAYIKNYGYRTAYTWLDNDQPGKEATKAFDAFFKTEEGLSHKAMNHIYAPYKDVNAWHMQKIGLSDE